MMPSFPIPPHLVPTNESILDMRWFAAKSTLLVIMMISTFIVIPNARCAAAPQDDEVQAAISTLDSEDQLVQFQRDIAPILRKHCLECHGPDDAKNDFRVDVSETLLDYVEPGDADESLLYVDHLTTDDEDFLMPPKSHGGPLSVSDLAMIRVWINQGADWPENANVSGSVEAPETTTPPREPLSFPARLWFAQGFLHPATVHFPIALFTLGAGFVILGWKWPELAKQIPLACLLLGAVSSVAATLMGWALAPEQGYGSDWNIFEWGREVDAHRWSAVVVTITSVIFAIIALISVWKGNQKLTKVWQIGLIVCAGMVGAVGHQGGEMSYGQDFYPRALRILTGTADEIPAPNADSKAASDTKADRNSPINHKNK
jgi:uncharacterized membrane protein